MGQTVTLAEVLKSQGYATGQFGKNQTMHVRKGSIYQENLETANEQLVKNGKKPITIKELPANLEDEDILEMANAGLIHMTVVDEHIGQFWKQIFTKIAVKSDVIVKSDLAVGYAMRKNSPQLKAMLDGFVKTHRAGTAAGNVLLTKYLKSTKFVKSATSPEEIKKFQPTDRGVQKVRRAVWR